MVGVRVVWGNAAWFDATAVDNHWLISLELWILGVCLGGGVTQL